MKKLLVIIAVSLIHAQVMAAAFGENNYYMPVDSRDNPDRYASFGFDLRVGDQAGRGTNTVYLVDHSFNNIPITDPIISELQTISIKPSFRFPASNRLTVEMSVEMLRQDYEYAGGLTKLKGALNGEIYGISARYYMK